MRQDHLVASLLGAALEHGFDEADLQDPAALKAALSQVEGAIARAEANVVTVVESEHEKVTAVLGCADAIKSQLASLEDAIESVPCESLRDKLEGTVLRVPGLRQKLESARAAHALLRCLTEVQRWLGLLETAMAAADLNAAAQHLGGLSDEIARLRHYPEMHETPLMDIITDEGERCASRLNDAVCAAWAEAALGGGEEKEGSGERKEEDGVTTEEAAGELSHTLVLRCDHPALATLPSTLHATGLLEVCTSRLGDAILQRLLVPVLDGRGTATRIECEVEGKEQGTVYTLRVAAADNDDDDEDALPGGRLVERSAQACDAIEAVLITAHRFLPAPLTLGETFWAELRRSLCEGCLLPALVAEFEAGGNVSDAGAAMAARVRAVEVRLRDELRSDAVDAQTCALADAAEELQVRAVTMRCAAILGEARSILLDESAEALEGVYVRPGVQPWRELPGGPLAAETPARRDGGTAAKDATEGGAGRLDGLRFGACRVSVRVCRLLALLHSTLDYACACGEAGARQLYARARDVVDLFVCISSARWQAADVAPAMGGRPTGLALVPQTALLVYNDARLLRLRCLTLGAEYARRLPPPLGGGSCAALVSFVDLAPDLSRLAASSLERVVRVVRDQLSLALGPGRGFERVGEDAESGAGASLVARRLSHELRQLGRTWSETLPPELCAEVLAEAIDAPAAGLVEALIALTHISEGDSLALQQKLLVPTLDACVEVLRMPQAGGAGGAGEEPAAASGDRPPDAGHGGGDIAAAGETAAASADAADAADAAERLREIDAQLPPVSPMSLRKLTALAWVVGARLSRVRARRASGELRALQAGELLSLLRALFNHADLMANEEAREFVRALEGEEKEEKLSRGSDRGASVTWAISQPSPRVEGDETAAPASSPNRHRFPRRAEEAPLLSTPEKAAASHAAADDEDAEDDEDDLC